MRRFALLTFDRCQASGIAAAADFLSLVNILWQRQGSDQPLFDWQILSPDGADIDTPAGIRLRADGDWSMAGRADVVFIPAMYYQRTRDFVAQVSALRADLAPLHGWHEDGCRIAATCTGTFLLAESGLLDGRRATTSWWLRRVFAERYPRTRYEPDAVLTEQDRVHCSGPHQARSNLLLRLVEPYAGVDLTLLAAKLMLIDTNQMSQAPYVTLQAHLGHHDALVARAQDVMQHDLAREQRLEALATELGTSVRTLIRRFRQATGQTPGSYLRTLRLDAARRLLETTGISLERIAEQVGYGDSSTFRRLFRRKLGLTPHEYRRRFGLPDGPGTGGRAESSRQAA